MKQTGLKQATGRTGVDRPQPVTSAPDIVMDNVSVSYHGKAVIRNATLTVPAGELMALVGPSGCGKTSLLYSVNRMTDGIPGCQVSGRVRLGGRDILDAAVPAAQVRRSIGWCSSSPIPFRFPLPRISDSRCASTACATGIC